jgi:UDP-N-acetylmuramyl pentapeptide phosphotransferase/UDP-N-acetylglucosamine-1-phosphate transferase
VAARDALDRNRKWLVVLAVVLGIALIAVSIVYWAEPAGSLPSFFPGHEAGSGHHHVKHGIAAFLLGLACLAFAWFNTGPKKKAAAQAPDATE